MLYLFGSVKSLIGNMARKVKRPRQPRKGSEKGNAQMEEKAKTKLLQVRYSGVLEEKVDVKERARASARNVVQAM